MERMVGASGQSQGYDGSDVEQMEVDEEGRFERCPATLLEDGTILCQHLRPTLRHHVHAYLRVAEVWHTTHHMDTQAHDIQVLESSQGKQLIFVNPLTVVALSFSLTVNFLLQLCLCFGFAQWTCQILRSRLTSTSSVAALP